MGGVCFGEHECSSPSDRRPPPDVRPAESQSTHRTFPHALARRARGAAEFPPSRGPDSTDETVRRRAGPKVAQSISTQNENMKASTINKTRGAGNIAGGKTRQAVGRAVRSPGMQGKGIAQEAGGRIQRAVGKSQSRRGN